MTELITCGGCGCCAKLGGIVRKKSEELARGENCKVVVVDVAQKLEGRIEREKKKRREIRRKQKKELEKKRELY